VLREGVYTLYRPADLGAVGFDLPIFTWLGGGCTAIVTDGNEKVFSMLASAGYFVVAYGSPDPTRFADATGGVEQIRAAIDWAVNQDRDPRSSFLHQLDHKRIAVGGMSCGGRVASRRGPGRSNRLRPRRQCRRAQR
jgi:acetyl esterase/lipase